MLVSGSVYAGKENPNLGGCQNYGPFWGTLNIRCHITIGIQKGDHNFDNHPYAKRVFGHLASASSELKVEDPTQMRWESTSLRNNSKPDWEVSHVKACLEKPP